MRGSVKKVVISAPGKDEDWTVIMGVNHLDYDPARHTGNAPAGTEPTSPVEKPAVAMRLHAVFAGQGVCASFSAASASAAHASSRCLSAAEVSLANSRSCAPRSRHC